LADAIDLIDRFLDGEVSYPLEWDDFISWEHPNPTIDGYALRSVNSNLFSSAGNVADTLKRCGLFGIATPRWQN
jgi:hypothetical protein